MRLELEFPCEETWNTSDSLSNCIISCLIVVLQNSYRPTVTIPLRVVHEEARHK